MNKPSIVTGSKSVPSTAATKTPAPPAVQEKTETAVAKEPAPPAAVRPYENLKWAQLQTLFKSVRAEIQLRNKLSKANAPKKGDRVRITGGRFAGKEGVVIISRKIRCFVEVEGLEQPCYVLHTEVAPAPAKA